MGVVTRIITLTTDFGYRDAYVASMKGVILGINPGAVIVDITHNIKPQDIAHAAYVVNSAWHCFADDTIHVVVVDPGVGSARRAVILQTPRALFLCPDNGILTLVMEDLSPGSRRKRPVTDRRKLPRGLRAISITNPQFWRHPVCSVFHGRDIFAPVAAHLSLGTPIEEFGEELGALQTLEMLSACLGSDGVLRGYIIYIDHFGNLITNIRRSQVQSNNVIIEVGGHQISGLSSCYADGSDLLALVGSSDYLEIASRCGNAAMTLGAKIGDEITIWSNANDKTEC